MAPPPRLTPGSGCSRRSRAASAAWPPTAARARGARRPALGRRAVAAAARVPGPRPGRRARGAARRLPGHRGVPGARTIWPGRPSSSRWPASTPDDVEAMVTGTLAGTRPPREVTAQLWRRSGGNPFFVRELTRLLVGAGHMAAADPDPGQHRRDAAAPAGPALHGMRAAAGVGGRRRPGHRRRPAGASGAAGRRGRRR